MTRPIPTTEDAIGYQITYEFSTQLPPPLCLIYNPHAPKAPTIKNPFKKLQKSPKIRTAASKPLNRFKLTPARYFAAITSSTRIGIQMAIRYLTGTPTHRKSAQHFANQNGHREQDPAKSRFFSTFCIRFSLQLDKQPDSRKKNSKELK